MARTDHLKLLILVAIPLTSCAPPKVATFDPPTGPPHAVVMVRGTDLALSTIVWDAGLSTETTIPGGFLGAFMFSVPANASARPHPVAIQNSRGRSANMTFTVQPPPVVPFPAPRVDYVTLIGADFDTSRHVTATLYVQGANVDVGAVVLVDGVQVATSAHKVLLADWHGVSANEFGYPIFHYLSMVALPGAKPVSSTIAVTVQNPGGQLSQVFSYKLPPNAAGMDSDGDGLLDSWETNGYDADGDGVVDVNLPMLGADPYRRDLLVELDIMDNLQYRPDPSVFAAARAMFQSAPILNPTTTSGIDLILDVSGKPCLQDSAGVQVCHFDIVNFDTGNLNPASGPNPFTTDTVNFSRLKAKNFDNAKRGRIYHYGIWGSKHVGGYSGQSDFADDFLVSFDTFPSSYQTVRSRIEVLTHELGHDLRQLHGGDDHQPENKPNYLSVMSYSWELRTGWPHDTQRQQFVTCLPFYYGTAGADEVNGVKASPVNNTIVDYSEGMAKTLVQPSGTLAAPSTFCGKVVDWNTVVPNNGTIKDFANWPALQFDGPVRNGWPTPQDGILP